MNTSSETNEETRRRFLKKMVLIVNGATGLLLAVPLVGYALSPLLRKRPELWARLGPLSSFPQTPVPKQVVYEYEDTSGYTKKMSRAIAWVVSGKQGVTVFSPACTHKACNFDWSDAKQRFLCPCHGGQFAATGEVLDGPPPRPLDQYKTRVESDELSIRIDQVKRGG